MSVLTLLTESGWTDFTNGQGDIPPWLTLCIQHIKPCIYLQAVRSGLSSGFIFFEKTELGPGFTVLVNSKVLGCTGFVYSSWENFLTKELIRTLRRETLSVQWFGISKERWRPWEFLLVRVSTGIRLPPFIRSYKKKNPNIVDGKIVFGRHKWTRYFRGKQFNDKVTRFIMGTPVFSIRKRLLGVKMGPSPNERNVLDWDTIIQRCRRSKYPFGVPHNCC